MSDPGVISRLLKGGHVRPPYVQDAVLAYFQEVGVPQTKTDLRIALDIPPSAIGKALDRLTARGVLSRYKIPCATTAPSRSGPIPGGCIRMFYLYELTGE